MNYFTTLTNLPRSLIWSMLLVIMLPVLVSAQEHQEKSNHNIDKHHRLALMISHTHIPGGIPSDTSITALIVPSWGLNYEYWFNHQWAVGLHNDMEISA